jgi:Glyoxalase/Bleomycin resistance protein/Dioxygenase superfamily
MFARPNAQHFQVAYVTNDIERAIGTFERDYDFPGFYLFSNVGLDVGGSGGPQLKIAIVYVNGVEIELIEPLGDTAPLYKDVLSNDAGLQIRFHHMAMRIEGSINNWEAHAASIDTAKHPIVYQGGLGDELRFIYTDERERLGHYVEHIWMSPDMLARMDALRPSYPGRRR